MNASSLLRKFKIQYASDLHIEFYKDITDFSTFLTPVAKYLALAGDIGHVRDPTFLQFMDYASNNWDRVFYIAGNHEYYAKKMYKSWKYSTPQHVLETHTTIENVLKPYKNIHYLHSNNPSHYLAKYNLAIVGTTLWSHIPDEFHEHVVYRVNDYNYIPWYDATTNETRRLQPHDINALHSREKSILQSQIEYWHAMNVPIIVMTHHMPSFQLISDKYKHCSLNCCFASNCEDLMQKHVLGWIYGHTHNTSSAVIKQTLCVVNAKGYMHESLPAYARDAWIEFAIPDNSYEFPKNEELTASSLGIRSPFLLNSKKEEELEFV